MKAACPTCGGVVEAAGLKEIRAALKRHCRAAPIKAVRPARNPIPPTIPLSWTFHRPLLSENVFLWAHWRVYQAEKSAWQALLRDPLQPLWGARLLRSSWQLTRVYGPRQRELDYGNLVGGSAKGVWDALVKLQVLEDDRPSNLSVDYRQLRGSDPQTVLTLTSLELAPGH